MRKFIDLPILGADFGFVGVVMVLAVLAGLALNSLRSSPLPLRPDLPEERLLRGLPELSNLPKSLLRRAPKLADLDETISAFDENEVVFVDAREAAFFELGRIPEARNLSRQSFQAHFPVFSNSVSRDQALIIYCSEEDCVDSRVVAKALILLGYEDVTVFSGGWTEWEAAGMPQEP